MSIILVEKDPFSIAEERVRQNNTTLGTANVRRPLMGLRPKDATFAYISVETTDTYVSLIDSSAVGGTSAANHNFILQSVSESRQEKVQIIETFGDHFAFFYGEKPIVLQVAGMLFNARHFNWKNEFLANYERFLRGTKCAENKTRVFLGWDDVIAQGYMLNVSVNYDKDMPLVVPFSFSMLLTKPPLDTSDASAPIDTFDQFNESLPWEARYYETSGGRLTGLRYPEYGLREDGKEDKILVRHDVHVIGTDGQVEIKTFANGFVPDDTDGEGKSAFWVSGRDPGKKQWNGADEALLKINATLVAEETGVDIVNVVQGLRGDASSFPLTKRDSATLRIVESLGTGVSNSSAVVDDAPVVE